MKITIINSERKEKRYTRMELDEFVGQLSEGTLRPASYHAPMKEVCFAAEWQKLNGELKTKEVNCLVLLSLENLRDLPTAEEGHQCLEGRRRFVGQGPEPIHRLEPHSPLLPHAGLH